MRPPLEIVLFFGWWIGLMLIAALPPASEHPWWATAGVCATLAFPMTALTAWPLRDLWGGRW